MNKNLIIYSLIAVGIFLIVVSIMYPIYNDFLPLNTKIIISSLIAIDAILYFVSAWGINRNIKWIYYLTIILIFVNAIASLSDQLGLYDILAFVIHVFLFILLIINYKQKFDYSK